MAIFVFLLILLSLAYIALFVLYANGWRHLAQDVILSNYQSSTKVSVIIPARNEEKYIKQCIDSILAQHYNAAFEVIVINDHSSDATLSILQSYGDKIVIINLQDEINKNELLNAYKKKAIELAVQKATGDLIITTDADTIRDKNWITAFVQCYEKGKHKIIAGPVNYLSEKSILKIFQTIDFITMQGITAASLYYHFNSTCNGANLAYSKKVFVEVNGFANIDNIASGDDMLLMHKILQKYPRGAYYLKNKDAIVNTYAMATLGTFLQQRIRWASKAKYYTDKRVTAVLGTVFLYNIAFVVMVVLAAIGKFHLLGLSVLILVKIGFEFILVKPVCDFFQKQNIVIWHILLQPFHLLYIIICGALGQFTTYTWKGRNVQ